MKMAGNRSLSRDYPARALPLGGRRRRQGRRRSRSNRPERKNPLTFDSYAELRDLFRGLVLRERREGACVVTGAGGNFSSGGDVHEIIGPLTQMAAPDCWPSRA